MRTTVARARVLNARRRGLAAGAALARRGPFRCGAEGFGITGTRRGAGREARVRPSSTRPTVVPASVELVELAGLARRRERWRMTAYARVHRRVEMQKPEEM